MFETRSKDGKILFIVSYSYQLHRYGVIKYKHGSYMFSVSMHLLSDCLDFVEKQLKKYNTVNPTTSRYHKLMTGDIWDNKTETIINFSVLRDLLDSLDNDDKTAISEALIELTNPEVIHQKPQKYI
jgi:hypothetical protein